jgi:hypothetical protein
VQQFSRKVAKSQKSDMWLKIDSGNQRELAAAKEKRSAVSFGGILIDGLTPGRQPREGDFRGFRLAGWRDILTVGPSARREPAFRASAVTTQGSCTT